jgi:hypothetical protein
MRILVKPNPLSALHKNDLHTIIILRRHSPLIRKASSLFAASVKDKWQCDIIDKTIAKPERLSAGTIVVGTYTDFLKTNHALLTTPFIKKANIHESVDEYLITQDKNVILIGASNERSVFYGFFALEEWLKKNGFVTVPSITIEESAYFTERWMNPTQHGNCYDKSNFEYIARLGVTTTYLRARYDALNGKYPNYGFNASQGLRQCVKAVKNLQILSDLQPPDRKNVEAIDKTYDQALLYGIEPLLFVDEPQIISPLRTSGNSARVSNLFADGIAGFPALESLRAKGCLALTLFDKRVENHYRELLSVLLKSYPRINRLYVYNQDEGSDNCWPPADPKGSNHYPNGYSGYPYAAHLKLIDILQDEGIKHNSQFKVITGTWHWFWHKESTEKMIQNLPSGSVLCCLNTNDDRIAVVKPLPQIEYVLEKFKTRKDLQLIADDDFNATSDDLMMALTSCYPSMMRTYKKMNEWAKRGANGITQHHTGGPSLLFTSLNDLAWRYFSWHPIVPVKKAKEKIGELILLQLGNKKAADLFYSASILVDKAYDIDEKNPRPYNARLRHSITHIVMPLTQANLPNLLLIAKQNGISDSKQWHSSLSNETKIMQNALSLAREAVKNTSTGKRPFYQYWNGEMPSAITCKTYAKFHADSIEIVYRLKTSMLNYINFIKSFSDKEQQRIKKDEIQNTTRLLTLMKEMSIWDLSNYNDGLSRAFKEKKDIMKI